MKNLFVPYEIAKQLKEKGFFNEYCWGAFYFPYNINDVIIEGEPPIQRFSLDSEGLKNQVYHYQMKYLFDCYSPLYQQVIDWFDEKNLLILVNPFETGADGGGTEIYTEIYFEYSIFHRIKMEDLSLDDNSICNTRTGAINKAIEEALKLI